LPQTPRCTKLVRNQVYLFEGTWAPEKKGARETVRVEKSGTQMHICNLNHIPRVHNLFYIGGNLADMLLDFLRPTIKIIISFLRSLSITLYCKLSWGLIKC